MPSIIKRKKLKELLAQPLQLMSRFTTLPDLAFSMLPCRATLTLKLTPDYLAVQTQVQLCPG